MFVVAFLLLLNLVLFVGDGVVRVTGLDGVFISSNQILSSQKSGIVGMVFNIVAKRCKDRTSGKESVVVEGDLTIRSSSIVQTKFLH